MRLSCFAFKMVEIHVKPSEKLRSQYYELQGLKNSPAFYIS